MAIQTFDQYVDAKFNRSQYFSGVCTTASSIGGAAILYSLWQFAMNPGPGVTPATGAGATCARATVGAIPFTTPAGTNIAYLDACNAVGAVSVTLNVADRLVHTSGLNGTTFGSPQAVNTVALPARASTGVGVLIALEPYTSTGVTSRTFTITYTNTLGASKTTTVTGTMNGVGRMLIAPLAAGDVGVLSVQSVQIETGTTGTAGDFGVTLFKPIACIAGGGGAACAPQLSVFDYAATAIDDDACLWSYVYGSGAASIVQTNITIIEG